MAVKNPSLSLPLFLLFLTLSIFISSTSGQYYNARCSGPSSCNASQFLSCYNGYCQCDSRSQVFDHALQQCVLRPGGKCFFEGGQTASRFLKCARNSVCVSSICQCGPGYGIPPHGEVLCKPIAEKKASQTGCQVPTDCDQVKGLTCLGGRCQCKNASFSYQGMFGCVSPTNPEYVKMMSTLKQTEKLLKDNHLDINTIVETLGRAEAASDLVENRAQPRQLFNSDLNPFGTIDSTQDLFTSPQTPQGQAFGGLFNAFNSVGSLLGRQNQNQAYGPPGQGGQGGYGGGTGGGTGTGGYSGGQNNQLPRNNFPLITNFLNLFNQLIPFLRRVAQLLNPLRFVQRLLSTLRTLFPVGGLPTGGGLGLGGLRLPGLGLGQLGQGQGGYSGGGGSPGSGSPGSSYGPPSTTAANRPGTGYGPPAAQSVQNFNQITPLQGQQNQGQNPGQQLTFPNYQSQTGTPNSPASASLTGGGTFDSPSSSSSSQFSNYAPQNKRQVPNNNGFQGQEHFNNNQNQNNQRPNNVNEVIGKENQVPLASSISQNEYPRQERFSGSFGDDNSPYLPEHL